VLGAATQAFGFRGDFEVLDFAFRHFPRTPSLMMQTYQ
jgi:hypothetical protein